MVNDNRVFKIAPAYGTFRDLILTMCSMTILELIFLFSGENQQTF